MNNELIENLIYISSQFEIYNKNLNEGTLNEVDTSALGDLDKALDKLPAQADNLAAAFKLYADAYKELDDTGPVVKAMEDQIKSVRKIGNLDLSGGLTDIIGSKTRAISDFFGADSTYQEALRRLGQIATEFAIFHKGARNTISLVASALKRGDVEGEKIDPKSTAPIEDLIGPKAAKGTEKLAVRAVEKMRGGVLGKIGSKLSFLTGGIVGGQEVEPLFGLKAKEITLPWFMVSPEKFMKTAAPIAKIGPSLRGATAAIAAINQEQQKVADSIESTEKVTAKEALKVKVEDIKSKEEAQAYIDTLNSIKDNLTSKIKKEKDKAKDAGYPISKDDLKEGSTKYDLSFLFESNDVVDKLVSALNEAPGDDAKKAASIEKIKKLIKTAKKAKKLIKDLESKIKTLSEQFSTINKPLQEWQKLAGIETGASPNKALIYHYMLKELNSLSDSYNEIISEAESFVQEMQAFDEEGDMLLSPGLRIRHKDSGLEYTVDSLQGDSVVLLLPTEPRFEPAAAGPSLLSAFDMDENEIENVGVSVVEIPDEPEQAMMVSVDDIKKNYELKE